MQISCMQMCLSFGVVCFFWLWHPWIHLWMKPCIWYGEYPSKLKVRSTATGKWLEFQLFKVYGRLHNLSVDTVKPGPCMIMSGWLQKVSNWSHHIDGQYSACFLKVLGTNLMFFCDTKSGDFVTYWQRRRSLLVSYLEKVTACDMWEESMLPMNNWPMPW